MVFAPPLFAGRKAHRKNKKQMIKTNNKVQQDRKVIMTTSTKTKSAKASATTDTNNDEVTYTVAKVGDGPKNGKFVGFVAMGAEGKPKIEWQVYMTDAKIIAHKINEGSRLTVRKSSIKIADAYDTVNKKAMLDKDGNTMPAPVVYSWFNTEGDEIVYPYGKGTLDIAIKIVRNETNTNIGEAQAKSAFDPMA